MKTLKLADGLSLPIAAVTEKLAWLGRTGSGKSYGAMKLAELMLEAGAQIGVLDPVGVWRSLRVPASKDGQAFEVVVFGGLYGDLPLSHTSGALVADLVVDRGLSFVLDVSQWIPSEQQEFARTFAHRFFHRKKSAPSAVHLFLEECQEWIPENPSGREALTLGEFQRLWKLGRNFGIGGSLISQRPQEIAKKALNMSGTLFAFQMTGPQERKAIRAWVADQGVAVDIEGVLQKLKVGEPHVESPMFLEVSKTVRILPRVTADLSSTPLVGSATAAKRALTPIDVEQLKVALAETIEKAKADDPRELKRVIAAKDREIQELRKSAGNHAVAHSEKTRDVPVLTEADRELLARLDARIVAAAERVTPEIDLERLITNLTGQIRACLGHLSQEAAAARGELVRLLEGKRIGFIRARADEYRKIVIPDRAPHSRPAAHASPNQAPTSQANGQRAADPSLGKCEKAILRVLVHQSDGCDVGRLTLLSGYRYSGGFRNSLSALRQAGLIAGENGGTIAITGAGAHAIGDVEPLPTGRELGRYWLNHPSFGKAEQAILGALLNHPKGLDADGLCKATGYEYSGGFRNALSALRTAGVLVGKNTEVMRASEELFG